MIINNRSIAMVKWRRYIRTSFRSFLILASILITFVTIFPVFRQEGRLWMEPGAIQAA